MSFVATASESISVAAPDIARRPGFTVAKQSGDHTPPGGFSFLEGKMSRRRQTIQKAKTPKDIADQYRELQELRAKVSKAERATAQSKAVSVENKRS